MTQSLVLHTSQYTLWMAVFFANLNLAFSSVLASSFEERFVAWLFLTLWDILMLDVDWWMHRFCDFTVKVCFNVPLWLGWLLQVDGPYYLLLGKEEAIRRYGEPHRWHLRSDYDNYKLHWMRERPELFKVGKFRCYWWWVIFSLALVVLGFCWYLL